jgi:hypothetical protein
MKTTRYSCPTGIKLEFSRQIFENCSNINILFYSNTKLHENPFSGSRVLSCGGQTDRQTIMTNLIQDFRNFATTPKNNDTHHNMRCNTQRNAHAVSNVRAVLKPAEKKNCKTNEQSSNS